MSETTAAAASAETKSKSASNKSAQVRRKYILFVGNLSYDTTEGDLRDFFQDTKPAGIRLITDKSTKRPKGFAFVEFNGSKYLQAALEKDKQQLKGRKVNVELTAGGGGSKSEVRKERIKAKNEKVKEEMRQRQKSHHEQPSEEHGGDN